MKIAETGNLVYSFGAFFDPMSSEFDTNNSATLGVGVGVACGYVPMLAGYLIDKSGSYNSAIIAAMIFAFFGFLLLIPVGRYLKKRDQ